MAQPKEVQARQSRDTLLIALQHLDRLLTEAVSVAQMIYGVEAATDPYRGLYVDRGEVNRVLAQEVGEPTLRSTPAADFGEYLSHLAPFGWLQETFELSTFDLSVVLLALAPEIDLRYERIYAYLQDDVTRKHPCVDLALNLLCPSVEVKMQQRDRFAASAPLMRHRLLDLIADSTQVQPPLLSHALKLDEQVIRFLLGQQGLDSRLTFCQLVQPTRSLEELPLELAFKQALQQIARQATSQPLRLYFQGVHATEKRQTAEALSYDLNATLLMVELQAIEATADFEQTFHLLCREAQFQAAILYLDRRGGSGEDREKAIEQAFTVFSHYPVSVILAGTQSWSRSGCPTRFIPVSFPSLNFAQRRTCWNTHLTTLGSELVDQELDALADRFRLTPEQIADSVNMAHHHARWRAAMQSNQASPSPQPTLDEIFMAARAQASDQLESLTRKISPRYTWDDIVLPPDQQSRLKEICSHIQYRQLVYGEWGFDRKLSLGKGLNVLFSGSPGTGKTMAAEVIANELRLDLYQIDLSQIVSKYIGETEKNLNRIFTSAESANAILLFDEADSLFGKRSEVKDAHDRYANLEVSYLLQKMEEYEGITILTTNLVQNLDEAFTRRLRFIIEFPFPDREHRLSIWKGMFPAETPIAPDLDFGSIAQQFKLAGGNIRNIALGAAFLAAESGQRVSMAHLLQATRREFQKMGRLVSEEEFL
ncbi:ATP-binding protein [Phormidesmis priestleyi]